MRRERPGRTTNEMILPPHRRALVRATPVFVCVCVYALLCTHTRWSVSVCVCQGVCVSAFAYGTARPSVRTRVSVLRTQTRSNTHGQLAWAVEASKRHGHRRRHVG